MNSKKNDFISRKYEADTKYEYAGMINALNYLCQEAEKANLDLVCLHLNIAIAELKEYLPPKSRVG